MKFKVKKESLKGFANSLTLSDNGNIQGSFAIDAQDEIILEGEPIEEYPSGVYTEEQWCIDNPSKACSAHKQKPQKTTGECAYCGQVPCTDTRKGCEGKGLP